MYYLISYPHSEQNLLPLSTFAPHLRHFFCLGASATNVLPHSVQNLFVVETSAPHLPHLILPLEAAVGCAVAEGVGFVCTGLGAGCAVAAFTTDGAGLAVFAAFALPITLAALFFAMAYAPK